MLARRNAAVAVRVVRDRSQGVVIVVAVVADQAAVTVRVLFDAAQRRIAVVAIAESAHVVQVVVGLRG